MHEKHIFKNLLIEFLPIVVFISSYILFREFFLSVLVLIISCVVSFTFLWFWQGKKSYIDAYIFTMTIIFYSFGYFYNSSDLIAIRDSVYDLVLGFACFVSVYFQKPLLKKFFGEYYDFGQDLWQKITLNTGFFCLFLAIGNEIVRRFLSLDSWIIYKGFSYIFTILFVYYTIKIIKKYKQKSLEKFLLILK